MDRSACILAHDYANYADSRFGRGNGTLDILRPGSPPVHLIRFLALLQNPKFHRYICGLSHIQYGSVQPGQQLGYHLVCILGLGMMGYGFYLLKKNIEPLLIQEDEEEKEY